MLFYIYVFVRLYPEWCIFYIRLIYDDSLLLPALVIAMV